MIEIEIEIERGIGIEMVEVGIGVEIDDMIEIVIEIGSVIKIEIGMRRKLFF